MSERTEWADSVDQQEPLVTVNQDGTKTIITYRINGEGKKVKVTQKVKEVIVKEIVNKDVARRKKWTKFGAERGAAPGPDLRTTQVGEEVELRLGTSWRAIEREIEEKKAEEAVKSTGQKTIKCRTCGGAHFTSKCPYKETLGGAGGASIDADGVPTPDAGSPAPDAPTTPSAPGKYIPASLRNRGLGVAAGDAADKRDRDDSTTVRITQLNESVTEQDIREDLLPGLGPIVRANIVRNRETGRSKGLAFVQFVTEQQAQAAIDRLSGRGYKNLILHVDWSKPRRWRV